jgi:hypothetical protein
VARREGGELREPALVLPDLLHHLPGPVGLGTSLDLGKQGFGRGAVYRQDRYKLALCGLRTVRTNVSPPSHAVRSTGSSVTCRKES